MVADPKEVIEKLTNERILEQHASDVDESRNACQERENQWRQSADLTTTSATTREGRLAG
jgi:hypothetical protein